MTRVYYMSTRYSVMVIPQQLLPLCWIYDYL